MTEPEPLLRFQRMGKAAPGLSRLFKSLTDAHHYFQDEGKLRTLSVSDPLQNGSIEATFHGTRIKFELLLIFAADRSPRGRVICMQCHCTYGTAVQDLLGTFTFDEFGVTDLEPDNEGRFPSITDDAPAIVLHFLDKSFTANKTI